MSGGADAAPPAGGAGAFVVGTGRCGSTLLSTLLHSHPSVLSVSEFFTVLGGRSLFQKEFRGTSDEFWHLLSTPQADMTELRMAVPEIREILAPEAPHAGGEPPLLLVPFPHLTRDPPALFREARSFVLNQRPATLAAHCTRLFAWLAQTTQRSVWVERSGASLGYAAQLVHGFEGARFVHLYRSGPPCSVSMSRHPYFQVQLARLVSSDPGLSIRRCLEAAATIPLDRYGVHWSSSIMHGVGVLGALPHERVLHVRFEGLCAEPELWLERIATFLQVTPSPAWVRRCLPLIRADRAAGDVPFEPALLRACRLGERALQGLQKPA